MSRTGLAMLLLLVAQCLWSQGPNDGFIMESEGTRHLIQHPDPVYPPIAKAAHVQGSILLHVTVNPSGAVTQVDIVGGPPMLRGAAQEAVKQWTYRPFEVDGKPATVSVVVSVLFSLGIPTAEEKSDEAIGQAFFPKSDQCEAANHTGHWADAVKLCGDLVTIAQRFPDPSSRGLEILGAHQDYGEALAMSGNLKDALQQFHLAVEIAQKRETDKDAEYGTAFYWLAFAEHASRMPADADRDYSTAEKAYRNAIANLPDMKKEYDRYLAHTLAYHSILKDQTGNPDDAKAMRDEALSLDPHCLDGFKQGN